MASQVLSGSNNVSYTNNTGQNVRIVINYMTSSVTSGSTPTFPSQPTNTYRLVLNWAGVSVSASSSGVTSSGAGPITIGRNLAFFNGIPQTNTSITTTANNLSNGSTLNPTVGFPTEIMIAASQTFSATCGAYNIVVIPEAG